VSNFAQTNASFNSRFNAPLGEVARRSQIGKRIFELQYKAQSVFSGAVVANPRLWHDVRFSNSIVRPTWSDTKAMARGAFNERVFRTVALPLIVRAANLGWHVGGPLFYAPVVLIYGSKPPAFFVWCVGSGRSHHHPLESRRLRSLSRKHKARRNERFL